jgi:hypothetical protein
MKYTTEERITSVTGLAFAPVDTAAGTRMLRHNPLICAQPHCATLQVRTDPNRQGSELVAADKWSLCVMACRIGWDELSLAGPGGSSHQ